MVVLILGLFFANFLAGVIRTAAANAGLREAEVLASVARYGLIVFTGAVTLHELGVGAQLVHSAFIIVFGAVALALALAFGLGCKDLARDWVIRYLESARENKKHH
ncbi:MAG: hypothetical protein A3I03_01410 [Candidatus Rokubacteria bacterium RIFCSPLOWO2_02_FULL_68_19]|nr:MAG: hypothetical protein A3I03_01410 [Candidatus Rokubacteria bacterium RIFCSPLOWO2_02_FULL_68_19]